MKQGDLFLKCADARAGGDARSGDLLQAVRDVDDELAAIIRLRGSLARARVCRGNTIVRDLSGNHKTWRTVGTLLDGGWCQRQCGLSSIPLSTGPSGPHKPAEILEESLNLHWVR